MMGVRTSSFEPTKEIIDDAVKLFTVNLFGYASISVELNKKYKNM
jgi:hypothetical protein